MSYELWILYGVLLLWAIVATSAAVAALLALRRTRAMWLADNEYLRELALKAERERARAVFYARRTSVEEFDAEARERFSEALPRAYKPEAEE